MPFDTPFKSAVTPTAGPAERPNLGSSPDSPTAGKTGEPFGQVSPKPLPENDLHLGTPDKGPGRY